MGDRMTKEAVAELEAAWRAIERRSEARQAATLARSPRLARATAGLESAPVEEAEKAYLAARALFEGQEAEEAARATAALVEANQQMAQAAREAAQASRAAARWAFWAALFTAVAAVATAGGVWMTRR